MSETETAPTEPDYGKAPEPAEQAGGDERAAFPEGVMSETEAEVALPDGGTSTTPPDDPLAPYSKGGGWYDFAAIGGGQVQGRLQAEAQYAQLRPQG